MELASFKPGNFNNYNMDENNKVWNFIEKSKSKLNPRKKKNLNDIDSLEKNNHFAYANK